MGLMNFFLPAAALLVAASVLRAAEPTPTPAPSPVVIPELEIDGAATPTPEETEPAPSDALAPVLREEVNLADLESAESMAIPAPPDAGDPEKSPEITEPLPGEEDVPPAPPVTGTVDVTARDNGKIVQAQVGNLVRIVLESNVTTGYNWELRDFEYGAARFHASDLVARKGGNVLFGAPGDTVITLQAVEPGTQKIHLVYRRPWEPPDQVAASFAFQLEVAP
jgi:predicted secreted protein